MGKKIKDKLILFLKHLCKFSDIYITNIITLSVGITLYLIFDINFEILSLITITGISISFGIRQYKIENDKIFKELFTDFNLKYDRKFNDMLNEIEHDYNTKNNYELSQKQKLKLNDYLNLCAEEYLWFQKGRITDAVWDSWESGMIYYLNITCINNYIIQQKSQMNSYYGLFSRIGYRINNWHQ